jgi:hypothetical protein
VADASRRRWTNVPAAFSVLYFRRVAQDDFMKRLIWSGLLAAFGALASIAASRAAATVWRRIFNEDPPD